jgi:hypothetical protein
MDPAGLAADEDDIVKMDLLACRVTLPVSGLGCLGDGVAMLGTGMGKRTGE